MKKKTCFYAANLAPLGPLSTIGVGRMRSIGHRVRPGLEISEGHDAAGYPMGCQIGRLTRHETPLPVARPSQATKISKPNRFAYPFRSRPRGVRGAPILNLRPHQAPSYRDTSTANFGLGVTPRRGPCSKICLLYTSPSPRDATLSRMPSSA